MVVGAVSVIAGGLVAAVTRPLDIEHGSWLAAYLVLVCGVAQVAIGAAQTWLVDPALGPGAEWAQVAIWNVGHILVIAGTLATTPLVVDVGGVLLVVAVGMALAATRGHRVGPDLLLWAHRAVLVIVLVSIPVGLVLAHLRSG